MAQKAVLLTISHAPHGNVLWAEGLRTAVGIISATDEHTVTVVFLGQGAFAALACLDRRETGRYLATLAEWDCRVAVEGESLQAAGIGTDEVAPDVEVIPRAALRAMVASADFVIDF
jgi:sulfur relay (sulfurtransferase) DsrF/TusC family protein